MTWPGGDLGNLSSVGFDVVQESLKLVVSCGGRYGKVESSFSLCFDLLASVFKLTPPPRAVLGSVKSCRLVTADCRVGAG